MDIADHTSSNAVGMKAMYSNLLRFSGLAIRHAFMMAKQISRYLLCNLAIM